MMPITFIIRYTPGNKPVLTMRYLGTTEIEISTEDLDILISRVLETRHLLNRKVEIE